MTACKNAGTAEEEENSRNIHSRITEQYHTRKYESAEESGIYGAGSMN